MCRKEQTTLCHITGVAATILDRSSIVRCDDGLPEECTETCC